MSAHLGRRRGVNCEPHMRMTFLTWEEGKQKILYRYGDVWGRSSALWKCAMLAVT